MTIARKNSSDQTCADYAERLRAELAAFDWGLVQQFARELLQSWRDDRQLFICGNGGSAGNAMHLANDYLYGIASEGTGMRVTALPANAAVLTCLANDLSYPQVFSRQLQVLARPGDWLLAFSGSGNSANIVEALRTARAIGVRTCAVLGFNGGLCKSMTDICIHFPVDDMQIAEDLQLIVGHMVMQILKKETAKQ